MKLKGRFEKRSINEDGSMEVIFKVDGYRDKKQLQLLEDKDYQLDIKEYHDTRSLQQNALMWQVIGMIANHVGIDEWSIYCDCLEKCGAKYEYIQAPTESSAMLENAFRAIKKLNSFENEKGRWITTFKCYYGSSKMNTKEMVQLLELVLDTASSLGIEYGNSKEEYI